MISGKLELTIKINELPHSQEIKDKWREFFVNCDGQKIVVRVKPKVWKKLTDVNETYPAWGAKITGKMGAPIPGGFELLEPGIQTFEKTSKAPKEELAA